MTQAQAEPGVLAKFLTLLISALLLALGFMFSMVVLVGGAVIGLAVFAWFWWRTRALRRAIRERQPAHRAYGNFDGQVIDGEAVVVEDDQSGEADVLTSETRNDSRGDFPGRR